MAHSSSSSSSPPPPPSPPTTTTSRSMGPPTTTTSRSMGRAVHLPRWQLDAEVSECPICHLRFNFWYRKHHCRRCGRVICALCSPHRITIPRPFVVRPPIPEAAFAPGQYARQNGERDMFLEDARQLNGVGNNGTDLPMASSMPSHAAVTWPRETASTMIFSAEGLLVGPDLLDGGEEVRICNPCVPDPNNEPPPQQQLQLLQHQRLQQEINRNHRPRGSPQGRQRDIFVAERGDPDAGVAVESFSRSSHLRNLMRTRRSTVGGPQFSGGGGLESESESGRPGEGEEEEVGRSTSRYDDPLPPTQPSNVGVSRDKSPPRNHRHAVSDSGSHLTLGGYDIYLPHGHHGRQAWPLPEIPQEGLSPRPGGPSRPPFARVDRRSNDVPSTTSYSRTSSSAAEEQERRDAGEIHDETAYCPICYRRLPTGDHNSPRIAREEHIMSCIAGHSSSPSSRRGQTPREGYQAPSSTRGGSLPVVPMASSSSISDAARPGLGARIPGASRVGHANGAASHAPAQLSRESSSLPHRSFTRGATTASHARHHSSQPPLPQQHASHPFFNYRSSHQQEVDYPRMITYAATEKDCVTHDGDSRKSEGSASNSADEPVTPAECVICFEDFEPGVLLARLECLCKFHDACLRKWWKSQASSSASSAFPGSSTAGGKNTARWSCPVHYQGLY